jgi:hypothetical protein
VLQELDGRLLCLQVLPLQLTDVLGGLVDFSLQRFLLHEQFIFVGTLHVALVDAVDAY